MERNFGSDFRKLTRAFGRHHDTAPKRRPGDDEWARPPDFAARASTRLELEDARADVREHERRFTTSPENPQFVEPGSERSGVSTFGKVASVLAGALVLVGIFLAIQAIKNIGGSPIAFVDGTTTETFESAANETCTWTVRGDLENKLARTFDLDTAWVVTSDGNAILLGGARTFAPGITSDVELAFSLKQPDCPAAIDDVSSGRIVINNSYGIRP